MEFETQKLFFEQIREYGLNLFLGAGFSAYAKNRFNENLPNSEVLKNKLIAYFNIASKYQNEDLPYICEIIKSKDYAVFNSYLSSLYNVINPDIRYNTLIKLPIRNILTTNIDDLIEKIYSNSEKILNDVEIVGSIEEEGISLIKLHGSVTYKKEDNESLVFSDTELATKFLRDNTLYSVIKTKLDPTPTLIWGCNMRSTAILQLLTNKTNRFPLVRPKWVVKRTNDENDIELLKIKGFHIIIADTMELLDFFETETYNKSSTSIHNEEESLLDKYFSVHSIAKIKRKRKDLAARPIDFFYEGSDPIWSDLSNIIKTKYYNTILSVIHKTNHLLITGIPGSGKTTLLKQLAFSDDILACKYYFEFVTEEQAKLFLRICDNTSMIIVFIDNLADNLSAFNVFKNCKDIKVICAERDMNFVNIKELVSISTNDIYDISDLDKTDIQSICNNMKKTKVDINYVLKNNQKCGLFEIVYELWTKVKPKQRVSQLFKKMESINSELLELFTLILYLKLTNTFTLIDTIYSYYSGGSSIDYKHINALLEQLGRTINNVTDEYKLDLYTIRSRAFADAAKFGIPSEVFQNVVEKFSKNVHKSSIYRYDVFRRKAHDADIMCFAFKNVKDGIKFYQEVLERNLGDDNTHYIKQQYALYLKRKNLINESWSIIKEADVDSHGSIFSIQNTLAEILFEMNINKPEDNENNVKTSLLKSFNILENCIKKDFRRKTQHILLYAKQAIKYYNRYNRYRYLFYLDKFKYDTDANEGVVYENKCNDHIEILKKARDHIEYYDIYISDEFIPRLMKKDYISIKQALKHLLGMYDKNN